MGSPRNVCLEQLTSAFALWAQKGHSVEEQKAVVEQVVAAEPTSLFPYLNF